MKYLKIFEDYQNEELTPEDVRKINHFYDLLFQNLESFVLDNFDLGNAITYYQPDSTIGWEEYEHEEDYDSDEVFTGYRFVNGYIQSDKIEDFNNKINKNFNVDVCTVKSIYLSGVPKGVLKEMIQKEHLFKTLIKMMKYDDKEDFLTDNVLKTFNYGRDIPFKLFRQTPNNIYPVETLNKKGLKSKYFTLKFYLDFSDIDYLFGSGKYIKK